MTLSALPAQSDSVQHNSRRFALRPAPHREPPFDDELPTRHLSLLGPLDQPLPFNEQPYNEQPSNEQPFKARPFDEQPFGTPLSTTRLEALHTGAPLRAMRSRPDPFAPRPTGRHELPEPAVQARRLVIGMIETITGRRPAAQLRHHTSPTVQAGLARDAGRITRLGTARRPATLHSLHVTEPADAVAEVAAVLRVEDRFRALALRLEGLDGRWRCVRLQIG